MKELKSRSISKEAERELWARAAGRCEFDGCNRLLYKSPVTQESVNISEKAHIYSFSENGPRGWPLQMRGCLSINDLSNLILVCHGCHKLIDGDKLGTKYSAKLLMEWKNRHERRVQIVTGISPDKKSHVVMYGAKIGEEVSPLQYIPAVQAMFPEWNPAEEIPVDLSMTCEHDDASSNYWGTESEHLKAIFERKIVTRIEENNPAHFSLFALAPQPLLILLGSLFTDKRSVETYQLHREPKTWAWQSHPEGFKFITYPPDDFSHPPVLIISLSDRISRQRITFLLGGDISIWELTIQNCGNDFVRSKAQLSMFRDEVRHLMVAIKDKHGQSMPLKIFPAMPNSCAVEFGRVRMPKADMPWVIFDQNNKEHQFIEALTISGGYK